MKRSCSPSLGFLLLIQILWTLPASSQWITQTNFLKGGWNAVYLHVDASHATITEVLAAATDVEEVWLWSPPTGEQFFDSPQAPTESGSQWSNWTRSLGASSPLQRLIPNSAYYVRVNASRTDYAWTVKGKPVAPRYQWSSSGLNFIGFATPSGPMGYERFFLPAAALLESAEIYRSLGGAFGSGNPLRLFDFARTQFTRGEAVWMRVNTGFNRYFGPFEISLSGSRVISFGADGTQYSLRLRNQSPTTNTITLRLIASETPPTGQTNIVGVPPILVRGTLDPTTLLYSSVPLIAGNINLETEIYSWTLPPKGKPGSDVQVVLGLARDQLSGKPGDLSAGVLQLTDDQGLMRMDLGVAAVKSSLAGLWVGEAQVSQVVQYLVNYQRDPVGKPVIKLTNTNGVYAVLTTNAVLGSVPRTFPLRLIMHDDGTNSFLLQRVFLGSDLTTNPIVATEQRFLNPERLGSAHRISAVHMPWSASNTPLPMTLVSNVYRASILTPYDAVGANPFVHQYHPDHDNLNATFTQMLPKGRESYGITRTIWLSPQVAATDYLGQTVGSLERKGIYDETITVEGAGASTRTFKVVGTFTLNRISPISKLTR
ncbi:MAG: hypothetical protein EXS21_12485 [Pedosphaera sp.]|nr:hypothetical protein [Pedosphaera sp.]